ncbi:hypothetical protein ABIB35_001015 [Arthrobacter sp. UYP6]
MLIVVSVYFGVRYVIGRRGPAGNQPDWLPSRDRTDRP